MQKSSVRCIGRRLTVGLLVLCTSPSLAFAGWHFLATTTSPHLPASTNRPAQLVTTISRNRIKYTTNVWALIADLATQRIVLVNHVRKRYWEGPVDDYFSLQTQQLQESQQKAEKMLQVMSLEQSQRMRAFSRVDPLDPLIPSLEITVAQTPEQTTIAGQQAQKYEVRRNGEPYEETWITTNINVTSELDEHKRTAFVKKLRQARTTPPGAVLAELTDLITKGYPMKTVNLVSQVTKEVVEAQQQELTDTEFTAPSEYTQSSLTETMSLR